LEPWSSEDEGGKGGRRKVPKGGKGGKGKKKALKVEELGMRKGRPS